MKCMATQNLQYLLNLSPQNQKAHQSMLHSVMALSLDHTTYTIPPSPSSQRSSSSSQPHPSTGTKPRTAPAQSILDSHLHSIRSTPINAANRFFDKPFTLIVDPSTRAGATGEHSPCDALVPSIVAEYGIVEGIDADAFDFDPAAGANAGSAGMGVLNGDTGVAGWERLDWVVDRKVKNECVAAMERSRKIVEDSDDSVLWFEDYGTDWIKSVGASCLFALPLRTAPDHLHNDS